jgi:hypothetical protein
MNSCSNGSDNNDSKARKKLDTCVSGYCLGPSYNPLDLPSPGVTHIRMNLEVKVFFFILLHLSAKTLSYF